MSIMSYLAAIVIVVTGLPLAVPVALGQTFPSKPVRFIVPYPPGGGADTFARIVGAKLSESWGQQMIIDNRAGAQGNIATALGAKAAPDGYTITFTNNAILGINPHLYRQPGFDALNDFTAITRGTEEAWILVVHPSVPVKSVKELAALAKRHPDKLSFGSSASGSQLVGELFNIASRTRILHVPYKGAAPAVIDLLAGNIDMMYSNPTAAVPHVKSRKLRALAVTGSRRIEALPDVPSAVEAGFPDLDVLGWYGVVAPAATPRDIVNKLNADFALALDAPDLRKRMKAIGQTLAPSTPEEFQAQIRADHKRWGEVVRRLGLRAD